MCLYQQTYLEIFYSVDFPLFMTVVLLKAGFKSLPGAVPMSVRIGSHLSDLFSLLFSFLCALLRKMQLFIHNHYLCLYDVTEESFKALRNCHAFKYLLC